MSDPVTVSRRLVAVFAADVDGYSRLMGADEVGALKGLLNASDIASWPISDLPTAMVNVRLRGQSGK